MTWKLLDYGTKTYINRTQNGQTTQQIGESINIDYMFVIINFCKLFIDMFKIAFLRHYCTCI